jgi:hypoxanthine phosphoribosyltransferase
MSDLHPDLERILISPEQIQERVAQLARIISSDYQEDDKLYIIGILKGAFIFLADLTRRLEISHTVDFMALSSYGKTTTTGAVRILMDLREPIEGQNVLIVEDIVDTGNTLSYLHKILKGRNPASIHTCVLLHKIRDKIEVPLEYVGFEIPDVWVVGYGLDFADRHRTLPYIGQLKRDNP